MGGGAEPVTCGMGGNVEEAKHNNWPTLFSQEAGGVMCCGAPPPLSKSVTFIQVSCPVDRSCVSPSASAVSLSNISDESKGSLR